MSNTKVVMSQASNQYVAPTFIEDVFSTYLYTGNSSTQTITNGIDLAGEGGLVWIKGRGAVSNHYLHDTERGAAFNLRSNATNAQQSTTWFTSFNADGFSVQSSVLNGGSDTLASWTFRKAPRFFDVVTYTGNGTDNRVIPHNLGSAPGFIVVKRTDSASNWFSYHRLIDSGENNVPIIYLNSTAERSYTGMAFQTQVGIGNSNNPALNFIVRTPANTNGATYVAYLFAHNDGDGDFGPDGDADIIKCGSFTSDGSGLATVDVGFEPQWVLYKGSTAATNWSIADSMRGFVADTASASGKYLNANSNSAELSSAPVGLTNTGFKYNSAPNIGFIYIAIRRGPMRAPESGTEVFKAELHNGNSGTEQFIPSGGTGFPIDLLISADRGQSNQVNRYFINRLADTWSMTSTNTNGEAFGPSNPIANISGYQDRVRIGPAGEINASSWPSVDFFFRRSPNFFDVVAYSGNSTSGRTVPHNLGVAPELMIVKRRSSGASWTVYVSALGATQYLRLQNTNAAASGTGFWNDTAPIDTVFTVGNDADVNGSGENYISYHFATLAGVSKVGSYTGNGSSQTIDCGFTTGARFILIKRTDSTSDWYVWNTARGIVTGNDPFLKLNTATGEVINDDSIDPNSSGFIVNQTLETDVNVSSASYIFYAIA